MKVNQLKTGVILSYVSMFLSNIIAIVYTPIMLRILGRSEYGLYTLVNSVVGYLGLLSFGFDSTYVRYFSVYKARGDNETTAKLNGMFLTVFSAIAAITVIAGSVLVANTQNIFGAKLSADEIGKAKILMAILVFNMALSFPFTVFKANITANERYLFQKLINIGKTFISPFVTLPLLLMGYGSVGMVMVTTVLNIIVEVSNLVYCFKKLNIKFSFRGFDFGMMKEISVFSFYIFINIIVDQINWSVDKFLLGMYKGTVAVAVYGIASQLNTYYLSFSTSISGVFIPKINRMTANIYDHEALLDLFTRVGRIQFFVLSLILSGIIFFGKPFICMWAGADYADSYAITLILVIPVTISLVQTVGIEIQRAVNMHKFRAYLYLGIAVANVFLSIPLCQLYGGIGCAAGTAAALIIGNGIIMNIFYHNKMHLDIFRFWKNILKIFPSLIIPIIVGCLIMRYADLYNIINLAFFVAVYSVCFFICVYTMGMNNYERGLILKPIRKVLKRG